MIHITEMQKKNLKVNRYGDPPYPVVLVHGGPGAGGEMTPVARELANYCSVLEPIQNETTIKGQLNELKQVLDINHVENVVIAGFSWGAWLSYIFASQYRKYVRKLILIGAGPFNDVYAKNIENTRLSRLDDNEKRELNDSLILLNSPDKSLKKNAFMKFGKIFEKSDTYNPITVEDHHIEYRVDIFENVWKEAALLRERGELLEYGKNIDCPVVAIHGEFDPHPVEGVRQPLSGILSDFKLIVLKKCGHKPWIEKDAVDEFYQTLKVEIIH